MRSFGTLVCIAALALLSGAGCGDDGGGDGDAGTAGTGGGVNCLDELPLDCAPAFQPTFDAFFDNQLRSTCSAGGSTCHSADGAQAGLVLDERDLAYDYLLGDADGRARVVAGDPECSVLIMRLESEDPEFVMPLGSRLSDGQRCAVRQWIANGAQR